MQFLDLRASTPCFLKYRTSIPGSQWNIFVSVRAGLSLSLLPPLLEALRSRAPGGFFIQAAILAWAARNCSGATCV